MARASEALRPIARPFRRHRVALAIGLLLVCIAVAHGYNMLHWPYIEDDEGDYLSRAWAVFHLGKLTPNTYYYDHVPLGWIQIAIWRLITGAAPLSSLASGRTLMLLFQLGSALLVIYIGRRASGKLWVGLLAAALFSLLPFGLQYQRRILLDNICTFWLLASLAVLCGRVTLTRVFISAVAFAIAVLSKEIALAALPALAVMVGRRYSREQRLFAVWGWLGLALSLCSIYVLGALIKGELFPAGTALGGTHPHVSLICSIEWQASRGADGGILDSASGFWHAVSSWVHAEPLLVVGGTAAMAYLIIMRRRNVIASTIAWMTLSLWLFLGRGGQVS
ncbi:MAG: glycosyltransferase, partial [Solirubrobacteraceae bacterium]